MALPSEERDVLKLHRDYISTVIYTLVGMPFVVWVESKIHERNAKLEQEQDMVAHLDPEIAAILAKSNTVSGKSSSLDSKVRFITNFYLNL